MRKKLRVFFGYLITQFHVVLVVKLNSGLDEENIIVGAHFNINVFFCSYFLSVLFVYLLFNNTYKIIYHTHTLTLTWDNLIHLQNVIVKSTYPIESPVHIPTIQKTNNHFAAINLAQVPNRLTKIIIIMPIYTYII